MSQYTALIRWARGKQTFVDDHYSRAHSWHFDGGLTVPASASPGIVPLPYSVAANIDPEEAFVASLSSCHMLFFLALAAKRGFVVDDYRDDAVGYMEKDERGRMVMTRVTLRPAASYSGERTPTPEQLGKLHRRSHEMCFIANSVRTDVRTEIVS